MERICLGLTSVLLCVLVAGCPSGPPYSSNVDYVPDRVYGQGYVAEADGYTLKNLRFDLLTPNDDPSQAKPALLMLHGGYFTSGSRKDEDLNLLADKLASAGYVCFVAEYRLEGDKPPVPEGFPPDDAEKQDIFPAEEAVHAAFVDTKTALRFIRANAAAYEVDPDRIAVFGESAGAVAALAAGVSDPDDFASDGPDFPVPDINNPGVDPTPQAVIDCWGAALYTYNKFDPTDPPIMVWHGLQDTTIPIVFALRIVDLCREHGIPYRQFTLYSEGHGAWEGQFEGKELDEHILEFLDDFMP